MLQPEPKSNIELDSTHMDVLEAEERSEATNIYQLVDGETNLHCAIRNGDQNLIDKCIAGYQADFNKIKDYLMMKYQWNVEDRIWLWKYNLIAVGEEQCKTCKELEKSATKDGDLEKAVFVVLQIPIDNEKVAVIHPDNNNRLKLCKMMIDLLPNGILSWNYTSVLRVTNEGDETFIELAASQGRIDVISRLLELGADLSFPDHCPLLAACSTVSKETIRWLLTEHFDHFDCTQRNSYNINAFLVLIQEGDVEMMDYVLGKMIKYRQKYYNETESEAFERIFHYEDKASSLSSVGLARAGPVLDKIGEYVTKYKLDLSYQWQRVTILICLMLRDIAADYCWSEIRKNPKLLGLLSFNGTTVLQELIVMGKVDGLPEIYQTHPEVKQFFENEHGINLLRDMLIYSKHESAVFILENHAEYLFKDIDTLRKNILVRNPAFYETNGTLLSKYFPMFEKDIDEARKKTSERYPVNYSHLDFGSSNLEFNESTIIIKDETQSLNTIRGANGLTLLHYAVDKDNKSWYVYLLESGCDSDKVDDEGNLPIHYVRSLEMFNLIVEKHPNGSSLVHRANSFGNTVLHKVCSLRLIQDHKCSLMERIIECGADVNQLTKQGETALFYSTSDAELTVLRKYNIDLEVVNNSGDNALNYHLRFNANMAKALFPLMSKLPSFKDHAHKYLQRFLTYNQGTFSYYYQSFLEENPQITKAMFDSLYEHSKEDASRMFCNACNFGHVFIVEKFFEYDYDLDYNFKNENECTPIIGLCGYTDQSNIHLMQQLLEKGVNLEHRNKTGRTALLVMAYGFREGNCHDSSSVQLLLDHGAKVDGIDDEGNTALHYAFKMEEWELMETLLANGADCLVKNKDGKIPLEMASDRNREIFKFMQ